MKSMILAAGLGTRLKPFTDHHPKALAPLEGETLLSINIKKLLRYGIKDIIVNVHHFADQIIEYLQHNEYFGANITISDETTKVLETGGGVQKAIADFNIEGDLLVCNADILSNINYYEFVQNHRNTNSLASLAIQNRNSSRKLLFDDEFHLKGWHNSQTGAFKPEVLSNATKYNLYAFSGIQIINTALFKQTNMSGKFSLIDLYLEQMNFLSIYGYEHSEDLLLDVGKPEALKDAVSMYKLCM